jgi:hypothetical protein
MQVMRKIFFAHLHQAIRSEFEGMLRNRCHNAALTSFGS